MKWYLFHGPFRIMCVLNKKKIVLVVTMQASAFRKPIHLRVLHNVLERCVKSVDPHLASVVDYGLTLLIVTRGPCPAVVKLINTAGIIKKRHKM